MDKEIISFGDIEIEKRKFHYCEDPSDINNIDIAKLMICDNVFLVKKVLNTYKDNEKDHEKIRPCLF